MDKLLLTKQSFSAFNIFKVFPILLLVAFISSCSHISKQDGPPNFYVDASSIPDATPKVEPLSKYGNLSSYQVFGKRYHTMRSSKNYEQVGVASWYGTKFHARRTSSGEPYDMLAMTAAHKTLPLPTYVEVTNLHNQRKIIVKVNDRGPFEANRIIDLSYVAAKKLGMTGHGTAKVKVKAIDPTTFGGQFALAKHTDQTYIKHSSDNITHHSIASTKHQLVYLQVASFKSKSRAEKFRLHLLNYVKTPVKIAKTSHHQQLYKVQIGPFKNKIIANKISSQLKRLGIKSNKIYGV